MGHREALLLAAKDCLREKGYARITARDLVAASGTNLSSIGYHFGSKEALLATAFREVFIEWTRALSAAAADTPAANALERVTASWKRMLDTLPENEALMLAFVESLGPSVRSPELRTDLAAHYARVRSEVSAVVATSLGQEATGAGADPDVVAAFLIAIADGFMVQFLIDPAQCPSGDELVASLAAAIAGLLAPSDAAPS